MIFATWLLTLTTRYTVLGETCLQKLMYIATHHLSRSTLTSGQVTGLHTIQIQQPVHKYTHTDHIQIWFFQDHMDLTDGITSIFVRTAEECTSMLMARLHQASTNTYHQELTITIHSILESNHMTKNSTGSTLMETTTRSYSTTRRMDKTSHTFLCTIHHQIHW